MAWIQKSCCLYSSQQSILYTVTQQTAYGLPVSQMEDNRLSQKGAMHMAYIYTAPTQAWPHKKAMTHLMTSWVALKRTLDRSASIMISIRYQIRILNTSYSTSLKSTKFPKGTVTASIFSTWCSVNILRKKELFFVIRICVSKVKAPKLFFSKYQEYQEYWADHATLHLQGDYFPLHQVCYYCCTVNCCQLTKGMMSREF